jgi:hypothetical protein
MDNVIDMEAVHRPTHYRQGEIEAIDIIEQVVAAYPPEIAYLIGNVLKYLIRAPHKGKLSEDLNKAEWYLKRGVNKSVLLKPKVQRDPLDPPVLKQPAFNKQYVDCANQRQDDAPQERGTP